MGRMKAHELGWATALDATLDWHLRHNLYPAREEAFQAARAAITLARAGEFDRECPHVHARDGSIVSVRDVIDNLHLDDFLYLSPTSA